MLVGTAVQRDAVLFLLRLGHDAHGAAPTADHRQQSPEVHHAPAVRVAKVVAGLVERRNVERRSVDVDDHDPLEALFTKLVREVHVHRLQRGRPHRICPREDELPADLVVPARAHRDRRKQERRPLRLFRDDAVCDLQGQALAQDAVGERREVRTMLLEHAALEEDHGPVHGRGRESDAYSDRRPGPLPPRREIRRGPSRGTRQRVEASCGSCFEES